MFANGNRTRKAPGWNACAAISPGHPSPPNGCRSMAKGVSCTATSNRSGMARADRLAQGTSCALRKPYPSPSGATHVVLEPLDLIARLAGVQVLVFQGSQKILALLTECRRNRNQGVQRTV